MLTNREVNRLNLNQIESDLLSVLTTISCLDMSSNSIVISLNSIPFFSMAVYGSYKYLLEHYPNTIKTIPQNEINLLHDRRLKIKFFDKDRYANNRKYLENVSMLNKLYFDSSPKFRFISKFFSLDDISLFKFENSIVGNSQLAYLFFQDKRLYQVLSPSMIDVQKITINGESILKLMYMGHDYSIDNLHFQAFEYGKFTAEKVCDLIIDLKKINGEIKIPATTYNISSSVNLIDSNTNKLSALCKSDKPMALYLFHLYSMLNYIDKIYNLIVPETIPFNLRVKYTCLDNIFKNIQSLKNYLLGNNLYKSPHDSFIDTILDLSENVIQKDFSNYMRHYDFKELIDESHFNMSTPYFGLIESCFKGKTYLEFQKLVNQTICSVLTVLEDWLIL